jgi:hypothetical protein
MRRRTLILILFILCNAIAYSQNFIHRSHTEFGIGIGRRAYLNSKSAMLRGTFYANHLFKINNVISLRHGLDVIYWDEIYDGVNSGPGSGYLITSSSYEHFAYGYIFGSDIVMNRVTVQLNMGKYLYYNQIARYNYQFYSKFGFKYKVNNYLYLNSTIRAHGTIADYIDFGFSIKIGDRKL